MAASRIRYRLSKPKPNIDAGKRVFQGVPAVPSAVTSQRGATSTPSIPIVSKEICTDVVDVIDASPQKPSLPITEESVCENIDTSPSKGSAVQIQQITITSPQKPNNSDVSAISNDQETDDDLQLIPTNSSGPKQRERKLSVRRGADNREREESTRRKYKKGTAPPERNKMTVLDLIYWNPESNPMVQEDTTLDVQRLEEEIVDDPVCNDEINDEDKTLDSTLPDAAPPTVEADEDEEDSMPVPQVKIGPDGQIMLDEQSLVIQTSAAKKGISNAETVHERSSLVTTYSSFRKRKLSRNWSNRETYKFYMALSAMGTDFSMMVNVFPNRERHELKLKYKREEKHNKALVDKAIDERQQFDLSLFQDSDSETENQEKIVPTKRPKKSSSRAKKTDNGSDNTTKENNKRIYRRRKVRLQEESDTESIDDPDNQPSKIDEIEKEIEQMMGSDAIELTTNTKDTNNTLEEVNGLSETETNNKSDETAILEKLLTRTRSGRQPKRRIPFTMEIGKIKRRKKDKADFKDGEIGEELVQDGSSNNSVTSTNDAPDSESSTLVGDTDISTHVILSPTNHQNE